jgi:hypothetical protein
MKTIMKILKWFFGITFTLGGIGTIFESFLIGLIFIVLGLFILPPTYEIFEKKTNLNLSSKAKWFTVIIICIISSFAINNSNTEKDKEVDLITKKASEFINNGQIDSAKVYIKQAKEKYSTTENKAVILENELTKYKSKSFAEETLAAMSDEEFEKLKSNNLSKSYLSQTKLNSEFIQLMKTKAPEREKIIAEVKKKKEQERIAKELEIKRKEQEEFNKNRKENIEKQFSPWDGSHPRLSRMIKENCRNPDSYEHIETRFIDKGNYLFIVTKYRAQNGFGGMSIGKVSANVDFKGNVIKIISQE